jgi:hypothetical protein
MKSYRILAKDAIERRQIKELFRQLIDHELPIKFRSILIPQFRIGLEFPSISNQQFCNTQPMRQYEHTQ